MTLKSIFQKLSAEEVKFMAAFENKTLPALQEVTAIVDKVEAWLASPQGQSAEAIAATLFPADAAYIAEGTALVTEFAKGLQAIGDADMRSKIIKQLGAELLLIVEGKEHFASLGAALDKFIAIVDGEGK